MTRLTAFLEELGLSDKLSAGRSLEKELFAEFDKKMRTNPMAMEAIKRDMPRPLLCEVAKSQIGVREIGGNNNGPMVRLYSMTIGSHSREAWCMAFVESCIAYVETKMNIKSPLFPSEHCMTVWNETSKTQRVKYHPLAGAVVIWRHGTSSSGHTGILLDCDEKMFHAVEGNTEGGVSTRGSVVRDGGGVYLSARNKTGTGSMKVVGFLKPF